jgi:hypothetical protein
MDSRIGALLILLIIPMGESPDSPPVSVAVLVSAVSFQTTITVVRILPWKARKFRYKFETIYSNSKQYLKPINVTLPLIITKWRDRGFHNLLSGSIILLLSAKEKW